MPISIHIGYDDHISGFELQDEDLENLLPLSTHDEVNEYIVGTCERNLTLVAQLDRANAKVHPTFVIPAVISDVD